MTSAFVRAAPAAKRPEPNADYQAGLALLQQNEPETALPYLQRAAGAEPDVVEHQFALAAAYLNSKRTSEGWVHLRQAVRLDPRHPQASNIFFNLWMQWDRQGVMNVGQTAAFVQQHLGRPDRVQEQAGVRRLEYGFMGLDFVGDRLYAAVDLRGLTRQAMRAGQIVKPQLDGRGWRLGHHQVSRVTENFEYVLPDQTVQNYQQMYSIQRNLELAERGVTAQQFVEGMKKELVRIVPNMQFRVLRQTNRDVLYTWIVPANSTRPAQHEVARILVGDQDIFRIAYVRMGEPMPAEQLEKWAGLLSRHALEPMPVAAAGQ